MLSHGYPVSERNDPLIAMAEKVAEEFGKAFTPGAFLVDIIPWCERASSHLKYSSKALTLIVYFSEVSPRIFSRDRFPTNS